MASEGVNMQSITDANAQVDQVSGTDSDSCYELMTIQPLVPGVALTLQQAIVRIRKPYNEIAAAYINKELKPPLISFPQGHPLGPPVSEWRFDPQTERLIAEAEAKYLDQRPVPAEDLELFCVCRSTDDERLIGCSNGPLCPIGYYHVECIDWTESLLKYGDWFCARCVKGKIGKAALHTNDEETAAIHDGSAAALEPMHIGVGSVPRDEYFSDSSFIYDNSSVSSGSISHPSPQASPHDLDNGSTIDRNEPDDRVKGATLLANTKESDLKHTVLDPVLDADVQFRNADRRIEAPFQGLYRTSLSASPDERENMSQFEYLEGVSSENESSGDETIERETVEEDACELESLEDENLEGENVENEDQESSSLYRSATWEIRNAYMIKNFPANRRPGYLG